MYFYPRILPSPEGNPIITKAPLCILVSKVYFHKKPDSYGSSFEEFELLLSNKVLIAVQSTALKCVQLNFALKT